MISAGLLGLLALALPANVLAKEKAQNMQKARELYDTGAMMGKIMMQKEADWAEQRALGRYQAELYPDIDNYVPCQNGLAVAIPGNANYTFRCNNIDLYSFKSHKSLGSKMGQGSSSWGWTSPEGREFIAIGQADGAAFAEIVQQGKLVYLGRLPQYSVPAIWREIRGFKDYMVIGSEADKHGIQVFDMRKLLTVDPKSPVTFSNQKDLTGWYGQLPIGRTHNVVVNEETNFAYSVGAVPRTDKCGSGIIFINMTDPTTPTNAGCAGIDGYVHDAQCLIYRGPHVKYVGREICYGYNEDTLTIYDISNKATPSIISKTSYDGASYTHQGWVLDKQNQEWLIMDDEYDEIEKDGPAADGKPVTYIWDIRNLERPLQTGYYKGKDVSVDHNQYVKDGLAFQSNYGSGFHIVDVSSIPYDPTGANVKEIGFFDVYPEDDKAPNGGLAKFVGSWSSYAMFPSGYMFVNTIERGAFVVGYVPQGGQQSVSKPVVGHARAAYPLK
jgi:choice-of-anchor B domain-containing protein